MQARRLTILLPLFFMLVASLQCRRATSASEDPIDREARDAFAGYLRIDTSNPPGNETAGARYLQQNPQATLRQFTQALKESATVGVLAGVPTNTVNKLVYRDPAR